MSPPRLVVWLLLGCAARLFADDLALVRIGESWHYYAGTNAPSDPLTAWRTVGFDDAAWQQGSSGFSTSPYFGDGTMEATYWPPSSSCRSYFLRRKFAVGDPGSVKWMVLRLDYCAGFVAYLNGQEILRRGLASNPPDYRDFGDYHFGGTAEEFDVSASAGLLTAGENMLAIEVHCASTSPPGYVNAMRLLPELLANFQRGPFVANASTNGIQIVWRTPLPADSVVEYGADTNLSAQVSDSTAVTNHVVSLTNLIPGTNYSYRVRSSAGGVTAVSSVSSLRPFRTEGDFSFLVLADSGAGSVPQYQLAGLMGQASPDLVLHCGDIVYTHFYQGREDYRCLSVYGRQMRSVPFYFSVGNEDLMAPAADQPFLNTFYLPTNPVTGTKHFYSFDHANAHFSVLFVPSLKDVPALRPYQFTNGSPQYCWLTNDLAASTKPWKFLFLHSPIAGSSYHRFDDENANGDYDEFELRDLLLPIAGRYGVQIIFSGHEHDYERSNPMNGVCQIITGGGGGPLPGYSILERDEASSQFHLAYEFTKVAVQGDSLLLQAIGTNGLVLDSMVYQRALPPPQVHPAAWHTPLVESAPANDAHGNIHGQTFDFTGTPIPTMTGKWSSLGRVYVNNDATNLYLGLEQAMIYSSNNIALFVESPRQPGVTNLIGLGDGFLGTPQGVDGLDFLENLSFTNFTPSIACLLGDEYADSQTRDFARPGLDWPVGQGVFHLDSSFSDVPGTRLQQFNRSPQVLEPLSQLAYPEQNANFIELVIPFAQLGGLRPGDTLKLAGVVGCASLETNLQTRELDTGFLGASLSGSGLSNVVVGAVSVRLALDPNGDEDMDGLPNAWEEAYGLNPFAATGDDGADGDPDHDGMTNCQEFTAGTNPRDPASGLRLSVALLDPAHVQLSWQATIGKCYELQMAANGQPFTNHPRCGALHIAGTTNETCVDEITTDPPPALRRYRLKVVP